MLRPSSRDTLSASRVSQKLEDTPLPSLECAGLSSTSMTFAQYEQLHDSGNTDEDEVDELASSVDDIESFYRLADSPDPSVPGPSRSGTPVLDLTSPVAGKTVELDAGPSMAPIRHDERKSPDASDNIVYTPPAEAEEDRKWSTAAIASLEENAATEAGDKTRATEVQEKRAESDFFMEERVKLLERPDKQTLLSTSVKASTMIPATKKPRFPLTQLSTESLALAAFKRKSKVHRAPSPGPSCFASGLGAIDRQPKDFSNVNGYLLLRSRNDLLRTPEPKPQSRSKSPSATGKKEMTTKSTLMSPAGKIGAKAEATLSKTITSETVASDAIPVKQAPSASIAVQPQPVHRLEHLKLVKCFGSFRLLQNTAVDRALGMLKIEVAYPEDADALSLRAAELSTAYHQSIFPQIFQPDIILSPRSCLFYYRLSYIYKLATILDERFEEKRMHHSKVLLEAIKLLSNSYDKITLVFEVFESVGKDSAASAAANIPIDPFTPAIKRALDKLHTDIGSLMENMERTIGDELDIEILYARTPVEAASFARERLDIRYSDSVQLGLIGWVSLVALLGLALAWTDI